MLYQSNLCGRCSRVSCSCLAQSACNAAQFWQNSGQSASDRSSNGWFGYKNAQLCLTKPKRCEQQSDHVCGHSEENTKRPQKLGLFLGARAAVWVIKLYLTLIECGHCPFNWNYSGVYIIHLDHLMNIKERSVRRHEGLTQEVSGIHETSHCSFPSNTRNLQKRKNNIVHCFFFLMRGMGCHVLSPKILREWDCLEEERWQKRDRQKERQRER